MGITVSSFQVHLAVDIDPDEHERASARQIHLVDVACAPPPLAHLNRGEFSEDESQDQRQHLGQDYVENHTHAQSNTNIHKKDSPEKQQTTHRWLS